ncbi:MAG: cytochrome P460 family protein [Byssovorax sp.]
MRTMTKALGVAVTGLALSCTRSEAGAPLQALPGTAPPAVAVASATAAAAEIPAAAGPFDARLLDAARAYTSWPRVTSTFGWASTDCAAPPPPPTLHPSTSKDDATHGQKLFHLFAQDRSAYVSDYKKPAPIGQVLVKESWHPIPVSPEDQKKPSLDTAMREGKLYRKGERMGLFLMLKLDVKAEGTDRGWIYGVVSGDGSRVVAAGKLSSCMGCHASAPGDRLFGPPS